MDNTTFTKEVEVETGNIVNGYRVNCMLGVFPRGVLKEKVVSRQGKVVMECNYPGLRK